MDIGVRERRGVARARDVGPKGVSVVPVEPALGAHPEKAVSIFGEAHGESVREPLFDPVPLEDRGAALRRRPIDEHRQSGEGEESAGATDGQRDLEFERAEPLQVIKGRAGSG